jgi:hypothetical protein
MSLLGKVAEMLGFQTKPKVDYIGPDLSKALQRNEMASVRAREALEELKRDTMTQAIQSISGKMK